MTYILLITLELNDICLVVRSIDWTYLYVKGIFSGLRQNKISKRKLYLVLYVIHADYQKHINKFLSCDLNMYRVLHLERQVAIF